MTSTEEKVSFDQMSQMVSELKPEISGLKTLINTLIDASSAEPKDGWMNIDELQAYHPNHPAKPTIYEWVGKKLIPVHKDGKHLRFLRAEVNPYAIGAQGYEEAIIHDIEEAARVKGCRVIIIDNLTYLCKFFDSFFAIGMSGKNNRLRYVKQVKVRAGAFSYDASKVIVYESRQGEQLDTGQPATPEDRDAHIDIADLLLRRNAATMKPVSEPQKAENPILKYFAPEHREQVQMFIDELDLVPVSVTKMA